MKRDDCDFFFVAERHLALHVRLLNWSRYVAPRKAWWVAPIWRMGKSNGRQWQEPELKPAVDTLDGHRMEKAISALPEKHRDVVRWAYVHCTHPSKIRKQLGLSNEAVVKLLQDGRDMLVNRRA